MKISAIRVNGFRGITPVASGSPAVELDLHSSGNPTLNLLLFGPNAFGKSSIADAIEWFFKGQSRGASYFESFSTSDNPHLKLGQPGFASEGYVELDVVDSGVTHTIRRTFDANGEVIGESLGTLEPLLGQLQDELIVLDHDQFRRFITDAHTDKWTTFSSLIGYEDLEHFRAGLASLSSNALTSRLDVRGLQNELARRERQWQTAVTALAKEIDASLNPNIGVEELRESLQSKIEILTISLGMVSCNPRSADFWQVLAEKAQPSEETTQIESRLERLSSILRALTGIPADFPGVIDELRVSVMSLSAKKERFDKGALAEFYRRGLVLLQEGSAHLDRCPFCKSPYDSKTLINEVKLSLDVLDLAAIQADFRELGPLWRKVRSIAERQAADLTNVSLSQLREVIDRVRIFEEVGQSLHIESFDEGKVLSWIEAWTELQDSVQSARREVEQEYQRLRNQLSRDGSTGAAEQVQDLHSSWSRVEGLENDLSEIEQLRRRFSITTDVVDKVREAGRQFREELRDFSARVVEQINGDIQRYYTELHPYDEVNPYLAVDVSGNVRRIFLKCDYSGFPDKDAASLLSESHRNSLGLAIMLAFRSYKHRLGSPLEFLVLDDVTQSLDATHRTNLVDLLENRSMAELSNQQILFLTHDRTLADLIKRPGENNFRPNWVRHDIRNWWLSGIVVEPCTDALARARRYLGDGDEIAAAVYARRALEDLYKKVVDKTGVLVRYKAQPWQYTIDDYRQYILEEVQRLHHMGQGLIDPQHADFRRLFTAQRILNLTVHDSQFLDAPMSLADVQAALDMINDLKTMFSCQHCDAWLATLELDSRGNPPQCRGCRRPVR